jgi:hypothetical protein
LHPIGFADVTKKGCDSGLHADGEHCGCPILSALNKFALYHVKITLKKEKSLK